jgi:hypothetical protein
MVLRQSISDWKNGFVAECDKCDEKPQCSGFFTTGRPLSRDNLDENGGGNQSVKRAAGSEGMIISCAKLRKHFLSMAHFDCRGAAIRLFP